VDGDRDEVLGSAEEDAGLFDDAPLVDLMGG
jgi:hypothetical protein